MENYELSDKDFKIVMQKNFRELQENTYRQPNKIRKIIHKQNEKFNKKIEIIKKNIGPQNKCLQI